MPRPTDKSSIYLPGLDGVRAIAVAVVIAYHLGVPQMPGGLLGVGVFFTLSGFLITSILLSGWERTNRVSLGTFWLRRARRLLPAVIMVLLVVLLATLIADRDNLGTRWWQSVAALFYVSNWYTIASGDSYFDRVNGPGPLDHLWSLAVEEQFYVIWPLLLLALIVILRGNVRAIPRVTLVLALVSFVLLWTHGTPGFDNTRAYEGTDTRAGGLLIGAAAALVWRPGREPLAKTQASRNLLDVLGLVGLVGIGALVLLTDQYSIFLYRGGILLLSIATVLLVVNVSHPESRMARALGVTPLRWVGERSYGIYLWHMPVVAFTPATVLGDQPVVRGTLQVVLTLGLSALSWTLIEDPIRRHGLIGALKQRRPTTIRGSRRLVPVVLAGAATLGFVGVTALSATALVGGGTQPDTELNANNPPLPPDTNAETATAQPQPSTPESRPAPGPTITNANAPKTSCGEVVYVGDSTSVGLMDKSYLPDAAKRVDAQFKRIGVKSFTPDILGARSIVERYKGQPNAEDAVTSRIDKGYQGCWTLAMGTNEVANQFAGGNVPLDQRIDKLMKPIGNHPVLWLNVKTLRTSGPWADKEMQKMNQALVEACTRYPNMRVYDWRAEVQDSWYINDKIHFTSVGYAERGKRIADAFARSFPASGDGAPGCLVRSGD